MRQRPAYRRVRAATISALALLAVAVAHAASWTVRALPANKGVEATMPWVDGPSATVADRINALLFMEVLTTPPPPGRPSSFALPAPPDRLTPVTPDGFKVLRLDERTLSLIVSAEGCGAYCEGFESAFLFDLASGRRVTDAQLLTAQAAKALTRKGLLAFAAAIGTEMVALRKKSAAELPDDDRAMLRSTYEECRSLQRTLAREGRPSGLLRVGSNGAELVFGRCTPHAIRALDDLGDFTFRIPAAELAAALSPYGRQLLLGDGSAAAPLSPVSPIGQVVTGSVGNAPVRLVTAPLQADGSFGGSYYYERYRAPIELSGRFADGAWTMSERGDNGDPRAEWSLKREGAAWTGVWVGADGRRLPVRLLP